MLEKIVDLHIHSKYSRACSPLLELPNIAAACVRKGIDIVATGDFTHPAWLAHIEEQLEEIGNSGLYKLKMRSSDVRFILSTEVSCIYKHKDKTRRLHIVIMAPDIGVVKKFNDALESRGVNMKSDGRPIMGLSAKEVLKIALGIDPRFMVIPAHAWTPWFAIFGSKSGYDSIEECFEEFSPNIRAIETGLSSDPEMNHMLSKLDDITLVSNSDAHSLEKLGREANVFCFEDDADMNYGEITQIIKTGDRKKFLYTIEFYPEEGMYHFDGHRDCGVCLPPEETKKNNYKCPKCKKDLTVGVLHRVEDLADRDEKEIPRKKFIPHKYVVPLREIIGTVFGVGVKSKKVQAELDNLLKNIGSEFEILLRSDIDAIKSVASDANIAVAIQNMRLGKVKVHPGYDGKYGEVDVLAGHKSGWEQSRLL